MSDFPLRDASEAAHRARVQAAKARGGRILSIVAYPGGSCSWVGETERVRVRGFDSKLGLANVLTDNDIVEEGGTEVIIMKRSTAPAERVAHDTRVDTAKAREMVGASITIGNIVNLPGRDRGVVVAESEGGYVLVNVKSSLNDVPGIRYTSDRLQWYPCHSLSPADPVGAKD